MRCGTWALFTRGACCWNILGQVCLGNVTTLYALVGISVDVYALIGISVSSELRQSGSIRSEKVCSAKCYSKLIPLLSQKMAVVPTSFLLLLLLLFSCLVLSHVIMSKQKGN